MHSHTFHLDEIEFPVQQVVPFDAEIPLDLQICSGNLHPKRFDKHVMID